MHTQMSITTCNIGFSPRRCADVDAAIDGWPATSASLNKNYHATCKQSADLPTHNSRLGSCLYMPLTICCCLCCSCIQCTLHRPANRLPVSWCDGPAQHLERSW